MFQRIPFPDLGQLIVDCCWETTSIEIDFFCFNSTKLEFLWWTLGTKYFLCPFLIQSIAPHRPILHLLNSVPTWRQEQFLKKEQRQKNQTCRSQKLSTLSFWKFFFSTCFFGVVHCVNFMWELPRQNLRANVVQFVGWNRRLFGSVFAFHWRFCIDEVGKNS